MLQLPFGFHSTASDVLKGIDLQPLELSLPIYNPYWRTANTRTFPQNARGRRGDFRAPGSFAFGRGNERAIF